MTRGATKKNGKKSPPTQIDLFRSASSFPALPELQNEQCPSLKSSEAIATHNRAAAVVRFVVKKHRASRLHYDFRLEWNGVLKSWAVPRGPTYCVGVRSEAVEVEDHQIRNIAFEGVFPDGMPGAGPTIPWDLGFWQPSSACLDVDDSLCKGCLKLTLDGKKLKGNWMLVRRPASCQGGKRQLWDLIKEPDAFARSQQAPAIVDEEPNSILSGKSLEEVESEWNTGKEKRKPGAPLFGIDE